MKLHISLLLSDIQIENTPISATIKKRVHRYDHKKILKLKFFENFGQNWANFDKKCHFLQKCDLFKITFCVITLARIKLETLKLVNVCKKNYKKLTRSGILIF